MAEELNNNSGVNQPTEPATPATEQAQATATPAVNTPNTEQSIPFEQSFLNIKYNKADIGLSQEEAQRYAQLGKWAEDNKPSYEKAVAKAKEYGFSNIADFAEAFSVRESLVTVPTIEDAMRSYLDNGFDEKLSKKFAMEDIDKVKAENQRILSEQKTKFDESKKQEIEKETSKILAKFPEFKDGIPKDFEDKYSSLLKYGKLTGYEAALEYSLDKQISKNQEMEATISALKSNQSAAVQSIGAVGTEQGANADHISLEAFEANKTDRNWVIKNFDKINASRSKW